MWRTRRYLIAPDTMDEIVFRSLERKTAMTGAILDGREGVAACRRTSCEHSVWCSMTMRVGDSRWSLHPPRCRSGLCLKRILNVIRLYVVECSMPFGCLYRSSFRIFQSSLVSAHIVGRHYRAVRVIRCVEACRIRA